MKTEKNLEDCFSTGTSRHAIHVQEMPQESVEKKVERLAMLLMTPEQIGSLLGFDEEKVSEFRNPFSPMGKLYRQCIARQAEMLHEQTMKLAMVGSPTAMEAAVDWLRQAQNSIE